jgi:hypothetical protein
MLEFSSGFNSDYIVAELFTLHRIVHYFYLYFIKYCSPCKKMFQIKVYLLMREMFYVMPNLFCSVTRFLRTSIKFGFNLK